MRIVKQSGRSGFTQVPNKLIKSASFKAIGLWAFMSQLPNNWEFSVEGLAKVRQEGKDAIKSSLRELERLGFLVRCKTRDDAGHFTGQYYELRWRPSAENPSAENPSAENPSAENPSAENPSAENPQQYNTELYNTELNDNTELHNTPPADAGAVEPAKSVAVSRPVGKNIQVAKFLDLWAEVMGAKIVDTNKVNVYAINRLVKKVGEDALERVVRALPEYVGRYEKRVFDYLTLERNWNAVMDWGRRRAKERAGVDGSQKVVIRRADFSTSEEFIEAVRSHPGATVIG